MLGVSLLAFYPTCFIPFCLFVCLLKIVYHVKDGENQKIQSKTIRLSDTFKHWYTR